MDEHVPPQSPSATATPNSGHLTDEQMLELGVDPSARSFVEAFLAFGVGVVKLKNRVLAGIGWMWDWANRSTDRRVAVIATASALILGLVLWNGQAKVPIGVSDPPLPPVTTQVAGIGQHKVISGENWESIAKANGLTPDQLRAANTDVVDTNTAWCKARVIDGKPISASYLAGFLPDGKTPRKSSFCQIFPEHGNLAIETLRVGQIVTVPVANSGPMLTDTVPRQN